jgi:CDGSH-type Zn-finger protein
MTDTPMRTVRIVPNGPLMVEGPVCIEMPDGRTVQSDRFMVAICTCRRSKDYPMCDTSHRCRPRSKSSAQRAT